MLVNGVSSYEEELNLCYISIPRLYVLENSQKRLEEYASETVVNEWKQTVIDMNTASLEKVRSFVEKDVNYFYALRRYDFLIRFQLVE